MILSDPLFKLRYKIYKWKTRAKSKDGRCKFYDSCEWVRKDGLTCLDDEEASMGAGGKPYCGKYELNEFREKNR